MGTFIQNSTMKSASDNGAETLEVLVSTGFSFTMVPAAIRKRLGVVPHRTVSRRLANGQREQRRIGSVMADLDGVEESILCVFGEPGSPPIIGAHILEGFLLAVDTVEQRLVPVEGLLVIEADPCPTSR